MKKAVESLMAANEEKVHLKTEISTMAKLEILLIIIIGFYIVFILCFAGPEDRWTEAVAASVQEGSGHGDVGAREERLDDIALSVD